MNDSKQPRETRTWPELAIGLYDQLTQRNAEITYEFENVRVGVPRAADGSEPAARWSVDGSLRVTTRNRSEG